MKRKGTDLIEAIVITIIVVIMACLIVPAAMSVSRMQKTEYEYHITITRPDGVVHKEFNIVSKGKLRKVITHGGVTRVKTMYNAYYDWENETIAPVGWNIEYTLQAERGKDE